MTNQAHPRKRQPTRTCVACRQTFAKTAMTRLVYTADGLATDPTHRANGRGAYLCADPVCWDRARHSHILDRALRVVLTSDDKKRLTQ